MRSCTVATFNTHWGHRPKTYEPFDLIDGCRQLDADVLALQEVWRPDGGRSMAADVAEELGYELHEVFTGRAKVKPRTHIAGRIGSGRGDGDWGQALLTRIPHGPVTEHHLGGFLFDDVDRTLVRTDVELDGGTVTIGSVHFPHLEHFSPLLRWRLRGVLPDRDRAAVVMGDFNMWRWVTRFVMPGWRDTARGATWPAPRPIFQIDHLLVTSPVVAEDATVRRISESDHFPIRARISVR